MNGTTTALGLEASRAGRHFRFWFWLDWKGDHVRLYANAVRGPDSIDW